MNEHPAHARPYLRTPRVAPDGSRIAFVYAYDIWLAPIDGGNAERLTLHRAGHTSPCWSPDGRQLAFSSWRAGPLDVYALTLDGAAPRRITAHSGANQAEAWSADGAQIFFSSWREQQGSAIYRVEAAGGTPIRWLSQPYEQINHLSVSPDGQALAFNIVRDAWWRRGPNPYGGAELWIVSNAPGASDYRRLSEYAGLNRWPLWAPDAGGLYFVSDRDGTENIWFQPIARGPAEQITRFTEGRLLWPSISADGATIVFEREFAIWRLDLASRTAAPVPIRLGADTRIGPASVETLNRASELALAPDGKKIAFAAHGEVFADFADKETDKEQRQGVSFRITNTPFREQGIDWAPDSRALAYTSDRHGDEEIYRYDFVARAETRLTTSQRPKHMPVHSPDGKWIAYACGDDEIRLIGVASGEDRAFVRATLDHSQFAWSPDSAWLVFTAEDAHQFENLYVQHIEATSARQITFLSNLQSVGPIWSPNGRFIIFTTYQDRDERQIARVDLRPPTPFFREAEFDKLFDAKESRPETPEPAPAPTPQPEHYPTPQPEPLESPAGTPTPPEPPEQPASVPALDEPAAPSTKPPAAAGVQIVFEGIERRLRLITPPQMNASAQCISPDSRDLIFRATVAGKANLWTMPLDEARQQHAPRQLTSGPAAKWDAQFAPDGKSFYCLDDGKVVVRKFPGGEATQLPISAEVSIDFQREKHQIFDECWRLLRDRFYDPTFRGLDWNAVRARFAAPVAGAQTTGELHEIIRLMIGELRASHLGIGGGGGDSQYGYTGLLFDPAEQARSGRLVVAAIVPDSPAALAADDQPIAIGDELVAVQGVALQPGDNLDAQMDRTVGRRLLLRLAAPGGGAAREVAIRPIAAGAYGDLRYREWVYANEAYVHRISGGRLGYVHIRRMNYEAYQQFMVDLDSETYSKAGVVIDIRFNPGGYTSTFIIDVLARRSVLLKSFRDRPPIDAGHASGNRLLNRPTILVINEESTSNAEIMAESYRRLGLGQVVGRASAGAVISTSTHYLIDGTPFFLPHLKVATLEGDDLEGTGRAVDLDVSLPLGEWARGTDRQLDAAVAALLAQIDA